MPSARGIRTIIAALVAGVMLAGGAAVAQDAATCELEPLELPLFGGTPVGVFATPIASPVAVTLSEGEAIEVLEHYVACINTGDPTRAWAVFTPRWFAETFADPEEHYLPAFEYMLDQGGPPTGLPLELVEIVEFEPGEGAARITATLRSGTQEWTDTLTLAFVDGQWLIDDVEFVEPLP